MEIINQPKAKNKLSKYKNRLRALIDPKISSKLNGNLMKMWI